MWGVAFHLLGAYLRPFDLCIGHVCNIQRSDFAFLVYIYGSLPYPEAKSAKPRGGISPSTSLLKASCLTLVVSKNQVTLCHHPTTEWHCFAIPTVYTSPVPFWYSWWYTISMSETSKIGCTQTFELSSIWYSLQEYVGCSNVRVMTEAI